MNSQSTKTQLEEDQARLRDAALLENLSLTPEQRIEAHESALQLISDLEKAGEQLRAKPK